MKNNCSSIQIKNSAETLMPHGKSTQKTAAAIGGLIFFCIAFMIFGGCSVRAFTNIEQKTSGGTITVDIAFAPFFVKYLRDLMGFETFSDVVDLKKMREFFQTKQGVEQVSTSVSNNPETISITLEVSSIETLFQSLTIPFEKKDGIVYSQITKDFIKEIIANLPAFQKIGTDALFIFERGAVPKEQFPDYLGWALSDYAPREVIEQTIRKEKISIEMKKAGAHPRIPDEGGWIQKDETTQVLNLLFTDILYEDLYSVQFSY